MGQFSRDLAHVAQGFVRRSSSSSSSSSGGLFSGLNPVDYDSSDPFPLWVIQVVSVFGWAEKALLIFVIVRQPRVIAEVIGGVLLGPSVMGHIPNFSARIFPTDGMPALTLTSTIGLVLFLFLIGLEIDVRVVKRNARASIAVSIAGLAIPLGLGAAIGVAFYREFSDKSVNFGYFVLFCAVAVGITAFPVLCRILTEVQLVDTTVGVVVLSAGVGNDVVGWILLALTVALVNASSGLAALWILLSCIGYVLLLLYPVRWVYRWLAIRSGSLEAGTPSAFMMTTTLFIILISAFFTDVIGIHPIFGGFLAGLIIPHENGYAISVVERLEDLITLLLLPIYFTLSGLKTNLGLLDNGVTWGYTILLCVVSFLGKFLSCSGTALALGFNWRESGAIGSLMSCKGLVELIALNIGLEAGLLDTRTFSMFVLHAIVLTFITTPLTLLFYPPRVRVHASGTKDVSSSETLEKAISPSPASAKAGESKTKFALVLDKVEQLPAAMTLSMLLQPDAALPSPAYPIAVDALRLFELSARTSAVLLSHDSDQLVLNDPVMSVFRTFGRLNRLHVSAAVSVVPHDEFPDAIETHVREASSQMVIIPWARGAASGDVDVGAGLGAGGPLNPFDNVFRKATAADQTSSVVYSDLIRRVFATSSTDVALFIDRGVGVQPSASEMHLFLPFFGGPDDRLALSFLVQVCANPRVRATVVRIIKTDALSPTSTIELEKADAAALYTVAAADTVYGKPSTQTRLASDTADNVLWERYTRPQSTADVSALSRIVFRTQTTPTPLRTVVELVAETQAALPSGGASLIIFAGRSRRMAVESHKVELTTLIAQHGGEMGSAVPKTLGEVGAALIAAKTNANLLLLQAAKY
ncbi:hypothetical protein FISHEDRAFT_64170 [Fistulina hepatica ATCC 64428]|uniref:Cation/H+ exchanger transmembrane domain-containing protein n=1 Tax=Fistulina hepatica ATCC 64428 TaxID=1128425 RepID=A0A0D7AJ88_9AGAR|nr:hypothetical protein FISHEDRAFT_64170 [Fistulina hepatica ATCC 64428]